MTTDATLDYNSPYIANLRSTAWWLYIFHAVCFLFTLGIFSFVPLILKYLVRPRAIHTWLYTHQTWQIRSFWWYFAWVALGWVFYFTIIGMIFAAVVWVLAWCWYTYRLIKGFLYLNDGIPMPYPEE